VGNRAQSGNGDTSSQILDIAERLVQNRGFNAFSYADVAAELHVSKAALHYHFAGKAELGEALLTRYAARFAGALGAIDAEPAPAPDKLAAYAKLYRDVLENQRMCLCGMLAAEYQTLSEPMRRILMGFFSDNETWLGRVLEQGRAEGTLDFAGSTSTAARLIVAALEGAMLVARPFGDVARFQAAAASLFAGLAAGQKQRPTTEKPRKRAVRPGENPTGSSAP
jgi:TetR/AcrR family transcriptional repressor of nem operon